LTLLSTGVLAPAGVYAVDRLVQPLPFASFVALSGLVAGLIGGGDWGAVERPRERLRRRRRLGFCPHRGYELQGTRRPVLRRRGRQAQRGLRFRGGPVGTAPTAFPDSRRAVAVSPSGIKWAGFIGPAAEAAR